MNDETKRNINEFINCIKAGFGFILPVDIMIYWTKHFGEALDEEDFDEVFEQLKQLNLIYKNESN